MMRSSCVLFISRARVIARSSKSRYIVFPERFVGDRQAAVGGFVKH
jgi:hypothetical protein